MPMLEVRSDELALTYRVEVWAEHLGCWLPADEEGWRAMRCPQCAQGGER